MNMSKYKLDGKTLVECPDVLEWAAWFEKADRTVAKTTVGESRVSTVFLAIDHQIVPGGPPMLFEAMVFGGALDGAQERYSTWVEAEAGHAAMVEQVQGEEKVQALIREREAGGMTLTDAELDLVLARFDATEPAMQRKIIAGFAARLAECVKQRDDLLAALKGVLRIADWNTIEFDAARTAIARAERGGEKA